MQNKCRMLYIYSLLKSLRDGIILWMMHKIFCVLFYCTKEGSYLMLAVIKITVNEKI
jgi:hypothetical protein